jgi:hypothetical protein
VKALRSVALQALKPNIQGQADIDPCNFIGTICSHERGSSNGMIRNIRPPSTISQPIPRFCRPDTIWQISAPSEA